MKKKTLAVLLATMMLLSLMPAVALADEVWTEVNSVDGLSEALDSGGNIRLTGNITVDTKQSWTIGSGVTVVLDLN